jgi:hypothetical protein
MNVNDLNRTDSQRVVINQPGISQPNATQNISISAVQQENAPISINASSGTGVAEDSNGNRPVIRINPNRKKGHRTVTANDPIETVNPDDYVQTTTKKVDPQFFQDKYMSQLDAAVTRKRDEFANAVASMEAQDAANREKVEAGLEDVGGEIQYMPDPLHHPMTEDEKVKSVSPVNPKRGIVTEDLEDEVLDESAAEEEDEAPARIHIQDNFNPTVDPFADSVHQAAPTTYADAPVVTEPVYEDDSEDEEEDPTPNEIVSEDISDEEVEEDEAPVIDDSKPNVVEELDTKVLNVTSDDLEDIDDADFDSEDLEEETAAEDPEDDEEQQKLSEAAANNLRNDIINKIINAGRKMNASQLVVSNKVISLKDAMKNMKTPTVKTAVWPLMFANRPYIASALKGVELAMLNENTDNGIMTIPQMRILFEHDVNPNRPDTLEAWAKTIPFADMDNVFAALFMASMDGANYLPLNCTNDKCLNSWLSEDVPMDKIIRFGDDATKQKFNEIKKMELTPDNSGSYESVVTSVSDHLAVGVKIPSLYTIMFEFNSLDDAFVNRYEAIINVIRFIDRLYYVDDYGTMSPIGWKKYPGDHAKTFKSKIITYAKLLKQLDPIEFGVVSTLIYTMMNGMHADIRYFIPKYNCPKCGHSTEEVEVSPRNLLFLRQQLVRIATSLGGR